MEWILHVEADADLKFYILMGLLLILLGNGCTVGANMEGPSISSVSENSDGPHMITKLCKGAQN